MKKLLLIMLCLLVYSICFGEDLSKYTYQNQPTQWSVYNCKEWIDAYTKLGKTSNAKSIYDMCNGWYPDDFPIEKPKPFEMSKSQMIKYEKLMDDCEVWSLDAKTQYEYEERIKSCLFQGQMFVEKCKKGLIN